MKKIVSYLVVIMLVLTLGISVGSVAFATEGESINATISVSPKSLPGAGTVKVTVTINNNGTPITGVTLTDPITGEVINLGDIATGASKTHENSNWNIPADKLGTPLAFRMNWTSADGTAKSGNTPSASVAQEAEVIDVTASASVDKEEVAKGEKVKFTFVMENNGNVPVESAYLIAEPLNGGSELGDRFSLDGGEKNTKTWSPTVEEDMTVTPVYTYAVNGSQKTITCDPITVKVTGSEEPAASGSLFVNVTADKSQVSAGGEVVFTVAVRNDGTEEVTDVTVADNNGTAVTLDGTSIPAGGTVQGTVTMPITTTAQHSFVATAKGEDGETITQQSNVVSITLEEEPTPAPSVNPQNVVKIDVSLVTQMEEAGDLPVEFLVTNMSGEELTNIVVTAESTVIAEGEEAQEATPQKITLGSVPSLPAGGEQMVEASLNVLQTTDYIFAVSAELPDGTVVESKTDAATITVSESGGGMETWQIILIIIIIAAGAVGGFLFYYMRKGNNDGPKGGGYSSVNSKAGKSGGAATQNRNGRPNGRPQQRPTYREEQPTYKKPVSQQQPQQQYQQQPQQQYQERPQQQPQQQYQQQPQQRPQQPQQRPQQPQQRPQMPRETIEQHARPVERQPEPQQRRQLHVETPEAKPTTTKNTRYGDRNKF